MPNIPIMIHHSRFDLAVMSYYSLFEKSHWKL